MEFFRPEDKKYICINIYMYIYTSIYLYERRKRNRRIEKRHREKKCDEKREETEAKFAAETGAGHCRNGAKLNRIKSNGISWDLTGPL